MDDRITDLYKVPDIADYEDLHLLTLWESCAVLEDKLEAVKSRMSQQDRQLLEAYIDLRNDLEVETVKTALRWGKAHYM